MSGDLTELRKRLENPAALAGQAVGLYMVGQAQGSFRKQGRGGLAWAPRSVPNRLGVLADLAAGRTPPSRRWDPRPAAVDTGRLRSSIAFRVQGSKVVVGSNLDYASDVQRGSTKTVAIAGDLRTRLAAWLRGLRGDQKKRAGAAFGPLFRRGSLTVTVPPRPFLVVTPEDRKAIQLIVRSALLRGK